VDGEVKGWKRFCHADLVSPWDFCGEVATPLLIYRMDTDTVDITVTGNTFENMPRGLVFNRGGVDKIPPGYRIYGNTVK